MRKDEGVEVGELKEEAGKSVGGGAGRHDAAADDGRYLATDGCLISA